MKVADLQSFIRSLNPLFVASGASQKVTGELDQLTRLLEPFKGLAIDQLGDLLAKADEYIRTGKLPISTSSKAKPKALDQDKIHVAAQRLLDLYERAIDPHVQYPQIDAEIKSLDKAFTKDGLVEVARQVGIVSTLKTKKDALREIQRKIVERKGSFQRAGAITSA